MQQREILEWLKQFSVNEIKQILTIKSPEGIDYIQRLLTYQPEGKPQYKPVDRMDHGYAENIMNSQKVIYVRDKYRYKKKKEEKKAMEELLLENITVSRGNEWALSVRKSFIQSGQLSECMLLFSDEMAFYQYLLIKSGSENESLWFQTKRISSFAEWLIHLFEQEIVTAYRQKQPPSLPDPLTFADGHANLPTLRETLIHIIAAHCETQKTPKKGKKEEDKPNQFEVSKEESSLLLKQCLQKFQSERSIGEIIFEYEWAITDPHSKISRILEELSELYMEKYKSYLIDLKMKEIEELTETPAKKKKKKPKKKAGDSKEKIEKEGEERAEKIEEPLQRAVSSKQENKKEDIKSKLKSEKEVNQQSIKVEKKIQQKEQQYAKQYEILKAKESEQAEKSKRAIRERINEHINFYFLKLYESSANHNKYRQICIQLIENEVAALKIPSKWELVLFGSYSVDFAIKKSDLDLVLIVQQESAEQVIYRLCEHLRATKWLRNCSIVEGKVVSILEFEIILAQIDHPKLKDAKKLQQNTIHVDISVTSLSDNEGLRNTKLMKDLLQQHPSLKVIGLILKELLKVSDLNKNYTGGIGSYALVMLTYSVLKQKHIAFDGDYLRQLQVLAQYMIQEFQPYTTLVTALPDSTLAADPELALNIEDPHQRQLINTNAKRIGDILKIFRELMELLEDIHHDFKGIAQQEKKKMKRAFFERWSKLFSPEQELSEALL